MTSKFSMNLDLENPRHQRVHEALYNEETRRSKLKKGHLTELFITFLERQFKLDGDMRKQVMEYIHEPTPLVVSDNKTKTQKSTEKSESKPRQTKSSVENLSF